MNQPSTKGFNLRLLVSSLLFCAILAGVLGYTSAVMKPTRSLLKGNAGSAWFGYLQQPRNSLDVVVFGDSHVFDGVDPTVFWKRRGITGYGMAGPAQPLWITQHYVAEAFRTQRPKVVAIEMSSLPYDRSNYNQAFQQINIGYMPWGANKLRAAFVDTPSPDQVGMLVDLWTYHGRWTALHASDFNVLTRTPGDAYLKGWQPMMKAREVTETAPATATAPSAEKLAAVDANVAILKSIAKTCRDNGAQLLLIVTPTNPLGIYSWDLEHARAALAAEYPAVRAFDLSAPGVVAGLDRKKDFHDGGHMSYSGAEKASAVMADFLASTYGLSGHRADPAFAQWDRDAKLHDARIVTLGGTP